MINYFIRVPKNGFKQEVEQSAGCNLVANCNIKSNCTKLHKLDKNCDNHMILIEMLLGQRAPSISRQLGKAGDFFILVILVTLTIETPGYAMHTFLEDGWVTHFGQLPFQSDFSGPWPFVNTINPDE